MHVKTFTGSSTTAVLALIKDELGPEAVILETREAQVGGATEIAITAAVERLNQPEDPPADPLADYAPRPAPRAPMGFGARTWEEEWFSIKTHLMALMRPELQLSRLSPRQRVAVEYLERTGVEATTLLSVYDALLAQPQSSILAPLAGLVPVKPFGPDHWGQKVHLVTGPFGAGKTTVLVRLAMLLRKSAPGMKIWVVNADSLRGGGRLLLKNYAQLCGLEYKEATNAVEFVSILAASRGEGVDRILVDLPGLPRGKRMPELLDHFGMTDPANAVHLVLSPQYGSQEMRSFLGRYVSGNANGSIIWTKLDEAEKFGTLVNVGAASKLPVSALSCGPELNETLVAAEEAALWRLLFKQELPCAIGAETGF